ncbi:TPA: ATP-grasp domain-containing protein [Bacillus cereus]
MECIGLIAGSSGDSLTDALHNRGYTVALVAGKEKEPGIDKADKKIITDLSNFYEIEEFFHNNKVQFIILGTGHSKAFRLASHLEKLGFYTSVDIPKSQIAKDKIKFKKELDRIEVPTPQYMSFNSDYDLENIVNSVGIPCVVKSPVDLIQPQKVNSKIELEEAILELLALKGEVLIERFISGVDCTVPVLSDGENVKSLGVTYYNKAVEYQLKGFENIYHPKLSKEVEREIEKLSINIIKEMGFKGLVRLDYIIENQKIYVLELNSVIMTGYNCTSYPFFKEKGIDIAQEMIDNAMKIYQKRL